MFVAIKQTQVPAGQRVVLHNVYWRDFESISDDLGNHRGSISKLQKQNLHKSYLSFSS